MEGGRRTTAIAGFAVACSACQFMLDLSATPSPQVDAGALDATPEAPASVDASGCEATFCEDFENGQLEARWTVSRKNGDAGAVVMEVAPDAGFAGTSALFIAIPATEPSAPFVERGASLKKGFGPGRRAACSFDFKLLSTEESGDIFWIASSARDVARAVTYLAINPGVPNLEVREDLFYADGGAETPKTRYLRTARLDDWVRFTLLTDFQTVTLLIGPTVLIDAQPIGGFEPTTFDVWLGLMTMGHGAMSAYLDNFECTVE